MAQSNTVRVELSESFLKSINFSKQVLGSGKTRKTPATIRDWIVRDTKIQGLAIRVYPGPDDAPARVSFFVQRKMTKRQDGQGGLASAPVRRAMGQWPVMTLKEARERAQVWIGLMVQGLDPAMQRRADLRRLSTADQAKKEVFGKVYEDYCTNAEGVAASTKADRKKIVAWMKESPLWKTPLKEVDYEVITLSLDPLFKAATVRTKKPAWGPKKSDLATAWKIYRYCSAAYVNAIARKGLGEFSRGTSPFSLVRKDKKWPMPKPRTSHLNTDEVAGQEWFKALVGFRHHSDPQLSVFADYLICSLIWGGRRRETQLLKWTDLDMSTLTGHFVAANTKSKKDHFFPLTPWVTEILEARREQNKELGRNGDFVFASRQHNKPIADHRRVLEELKLSTGLWITAHDLRRTVASDTARLSAADSFMVSLTLAHAGGREAVTKAYITNRVKLLRPLFEIREHRLLLLAGLAVPLAQKGPIEALLEFLEGASKDMVLRPQLEKRAKGILLMLSE